MPLIPIPSSASRIATQVLVLAKLNRRKDILLRGCINLLITCSKLVTEAQE